MKSNPTPFSSRFAPEHVDTGPKMLSGTITISVLPSKRLWTIASLVLRKLSRTFGTPKKRQAPSDGNHAMALKFST